MIDFYSVTVFDLENDPLVQDWISEVIDKENYKEGDISYIFCDDEYLSKKNVKYLKHNTLTDIISF